MTARVGSITTCIYLATLSTGNAVYALELVSPYRPQDYTYSIIEVCRVYITVIRKTFAEGPYRLGGQSAEAVYAYEVTR